VQVRRGNRSGVALVTALLCVALLPATAHADVADGSDEAIDTENNADDQHLDAAARITFTSTGENNPGPLTSSTPWTPPACYYAPLYTPAEFERYWNDWFRDKTTPPWVPEDVTAMRDSHEARFGEDGEFPDYNKEKQGDGMFWMRVVNQNHPDRAERFACEYRIFWVDFTDPPPVEPGVVDTVTLAELAWEKTRVPDTEVSLNPAGLDAQKVNLATWLWLDEGEFAEVSVRAELDGYGIWTETTARPTKLTVRPGTGDATTHPSSGVCEIRDGRIGEPYGPGKAGKTPPCGVTYRRATPDGGSYPLSATLTWEVTWRDYLGNTGTLPDGEFATTIDIGVEEVQTIVR
jgi:hypothetical protein